MSTAQRVAVSRGWSAADVAEHELVDDAWIAANTVPGKAPSRTRAVGGRVLAAGRTIGADPLDGQQPADLSGLLPKLPRPVRRALVQKGGLTRDQMRRIAARTGYPYVEAWSSHSQGAMSGVWGAMVHHTGTPWTAAGDYPTLRVVRDGRSDLKNSLCGFGLGRSGTIYLISEKVSWHAGAGNINGCTDGNGKIVGIEAESDGRNWTAEERDCYPRLVASILVEIRETDRYTTRHATYALPKGRKTDASGLNMELFWQQVYGYLANPASIDRNWRPFASFPIIGAIREAYDRFGGAAKLGAPLGPEVPTADGTGRWQEFRDGGILWHPVRTKGVARAMGRGILGAFHAAGAEAAVGWPLTDETATPDGAGRYVHLSGGPATGGMEASIYWHGHTGAQLIKGEIRKRWAELGWETGLGYPLINEGTCPDGVGRYTHCSGRPSVPGDGRTSIYWTPRTGARAVVGAIRATWEADGWETGIGYPVDEEHPAEGGMVQNFERGSILVTATSATVRRR